MPAGFRAGGLAAGIKASGRPDLAVVASRRTVRPPRPPSSPRTRSRPRPVRLSREHLAATSGDRARRLRLGRGGRDLDQRLAPTRRPGEAGDADQREIARVARRRQSSTAVDLTLHLSTGIIGTRLPLDSVRCRARSARPELLEIERCRLEATAEALRTTDSVTKSATTTVELPDADGRAVTVTVSGHRQGRRDDPPADGHDAGGGPDRRDRGARRRSGPCSGRPQRGRGTSSRSTATRARMTRSSSWRPGRRAAAPVRRRPRPRRRRLGAAIEAVARDLARQQAADGEGAGDAHHGRR